MESDLKDKGKNKIVLVGWKLLTKGPHPQPLSPHPPSAPSPERRRE